MKKKVSKNVKRRVTLVIGPISIGIFCVTLITIVSYLYRINLLNQQKNDLERQLVSLKSEAESMSDEITKLKDPKYIAKYARENYYYTKDGEYVLKIIKDKEKKPEKHSTPMYIYYILGGGLVLLLILIRLIYKKKK